MTHTIFYSWQKELPNTTNRGLIGDALREAAKQIGSDLDVDERVEVDQDTQGVPGSPPILDTILQKISKCAAFVPDVSFIAVSENGRPTPNPNVLIEYGYAVGAIGDQRILPVFNSAFGKVEALPFDMRHKRIAGVYDLAPHCSPEDRAAAKKALTRGLRAALAEIIALGAPQPALPNIVVRPVPMSGIERGPTGARSISYVLDVRVENHSDRPFFLAGVSFELSNGKKLWAERDITGATNNERRIEPGDSASLKHDMITILRAAGPKDVIGVVAHDKIGRVFNAPREDFCDAIASAVLEFRQIAIGEANAKAQQQALEDLLREGLDPGPPRRR